jgi:hypothetical protein
MVSLDMIYLLIWITVVERPWFSTGPLSAMVHIATIKIPGISVPGSTTLKKLASLAFKSKLEEKMMNEAND